MPRRFTRLRAWLVARGWVRRFSEVDMAEEIRLHLEQRIAEFVAQGLSPEQARAAAYRQFGPVEPVKEACRDERRRAVWLETVWQDLRYGVRSLARDRAFTVTAVLTLTLGVGLVTAFFTIFNGILLKPWPLPEPRTLVTATRRVSAAAYRHLRDHTRSIDLVAFATCLSFIEDDFKGSGFRCVSGNYFDVLRVPLIHGRGFRLEEDVVGAPVPVVVIGYELWRDRFSLSPDAVGRTIRLNRVPFQIVGIAARGATDEPSPNLPRLWVPLAAYPLVTSDTEHNRAFLLDPERSGVRLAGRLHRPHTVSGVGAELTALHRGLRVGENDRVTAIVMTATSAIHQPWEDSGVALVGLIVAGIVLVLLVACANTGNLQLARGSRRRSEFLVRLALGASRRRIVQQLLTEGLILAAVTSAMSLLLASIAARLVTRWLADDSPDVGIDFSPDWRVALLTISVAGFTILVTALGPALRGTRRLVVTARSAAAPVRARAWFVVVQVGLSAVLIVGASLLARGLLQASSLDPGFDADGVAVVSVRVPSPQARDPRVAAIRTGIRDALKTSGSPLAADTGPSRSFGSVSLRDPETTIRQVSGHVVSADYLRLLAVPLREGRLLEENDTPAEVVVNETFARQAWPGRPALGSMFVTDTAEAAGAAGTGRDDPIAATRSRVVVGVVGDMRPESYRPGTPVWPMFFERGAGDRLYVRNVAAVLDRARVAAHAIDPTANLAFNPVSATLEVGLVELRIGVGLAWALGLVALAMSAAGIFGVFALVAEERQREVGIRLALGAGSRAIVRMMLTHAGRAMVIGLLVGFLAALVAAPLLRSYLVGVGPHDPIAFGAAILVLTAAAAAATAIPIRRALRIDPAVTLRAE